MENKEALLNNQTPELNRDEEIKALKEQIAALKQEQQEKMLNDSLNKKIEELVAQRMNERENSERQRIEDARRMIEEADKNAAMEEELRKNERYNQLTSWRENKLEEFKREIEKLKVMGENTEHSYNMYRDYNMYRYNAANNDERAKKMLGRINMTFAAMNLGGEKLVNIFKKNIGITSEE